ncbi:E3 ubiquitin-protein ligase ATL6-like [Olea europaea var. sylvestris]|uniref:E3 ubiquitin-protein ligase ATL6-like n=1 Tax=Olea europaea var. sylvestris TaxID=158386 RepID=UPI000C1CF095|nr:E3 ubiquitin-protein ligase ATL6-like [Olea europaea var. sylvestris]
MSPVIVLLVVDSLLFLMVFIVSACWGKFRDDARAPPAPPVIDLPPPALRVIPIIYHPTSAAAPVINRLPPATVPPGAQTSTRSQTEEEGKKYEIVIDVYVEQAADGERECSICLSEYENRELLGHLPVCNHIFHFDCIKIWLEINRTCPLCRRSNGDEHEL